MLTVVGGRVFAIRNATWGMQGIMPLIVRKAENFRDIGLVGELSFSFKCSPKSSSSSHAQSSLQRHT